MNSRELILSILLIVEQNGEYSHIAIRNVLDKYRYLDRKDRAFIQIVAEGTIERKLTLDYMISCYSTVKVKKMKPVIREILRMSVYQMKFMDHIPVSAICNEAVNLAKKKGFSNLKGFVNGILRNMARDEKDWEYPDPSIRYSMPQWIYDSFVSWYGEDYAGKMAESSLMKPLLTIRCCHMKNTPKELKLLLEAEGCEVLESGILEDVFYLQHFSSLTELKSFREGRFMVQDLSSVLAGVAASPKKGSRVLDVCAAPGGKSLHLADMMEGTGSIEARDISENKAAMIRENSARISCDNISVRIQDALVLRQEDIGSADLVIADLPCSGLGVLARKSDLKYRIQPEDLETLAQLQRDILTVVSQYVKPGGTLLYSTCTVNPGENIENVRFIEKELPFSRAGIQECLPEGIDALSKEEGCVQLLQGINPCDGFFISKFTRDK